MLREILHRQLKQTTLVICFCFAVLIGLIAARFKIGTPIELFWPLAICFLLSLRKRNLLTLTFGIGMFFVLASWRGGFFVNKLAADSSHNYQKITVFGVAKADAVYGKQYQLETTLGHVRIMSPKQSDFWGDLTIRGFGESAIYRGDTVQVTGKLYPTRGNNVGVISFANLHVVSRGNSWVDNFRRRFTAGIQNTLPEPMASFALGLLVGQRNTLPQKITEQLQHVGLTHIIAVSGYNLTILVVACQRLFAKRSKYQTLAASVSLIFFFLALTGSSPPIVRASVISLLSLAAWNYGRQIKPMILLLVSGALTAFANPTYIWGNASWYLSFLAFFGVLIIAPLLTKRLYKNKTPNLLVATAIESSCASLAVTPYVLYVFGTFSTVGIVANILVVPFVPLAMALSFIAGLAGMILPTLAGWLSWPANLLLTYMLDVPNILAKIPHAFIGDFGLSLAGLMVCYAAMVFVVLVLYRRVRRIPIV